MKESCNIVKDLLPLYHDDICSQDSRDFINQHITTCDSCRLELEKYNTEIKGVTPMEYSKDEHAIKNIASKWKKDKKRAFLLGVITISLLGLIFSVVSYNQAGSYVADDGMLVESFGFIPLSYLFGLIAVVSLIILAVSSIRKK